LRRPTETHRRKAQRRFCEMLDLLGSVGGSDVYVDRRRAPGQQADAAAGIAREPEIYRPASRPIGDRGLLAGVLVASTRQRDGDGLDAPRLEPASDLAECQWRPQARRPSGSRPPRLAEPAPSPVEPMLAEQREARQKPLQSAAVDQD